MGNYSGNGKAVWLSAVILAFASGVVSAPASLADGEQLSYMPAKTPAPIPAPAHPMVLQGGVQTIERLPVHGGTASCQRMNGLADYQKAWFALGQKQYKFAAETFQLAGDEMEATAGETRYLAEARFAEAQTRMLMGQYDRATEMYKRSIDLFQKTDPRSFYLKLAQDALKDMLSKHPLKGQLKKDSSVLKTMPLPGFDKVAAVVQLSSRVTQLDSGVNISTLHNGDFFNRSRGTLPQSAGVDISDEFVKDTVHKAFLKMNCQETGAVGATNYSAPLFYKAIETPDGKPIAVGAGSDLLCPVAELKLNGKTYKVPMDLPHISPNTRNVLLVTDDRHVLAIDPRTSEAWKLCANFSKKMPDFNWWKLGRQKGHKFS